MARDSLGRMVARAARTGGRRPGMRRGIERFHLIIAVIVVLGLILVWYSRSEAERGTVANSTPPTTKDTWLVAVSFDLCGKRAPDLPTNPNLHGDTSKGVPASSAIKLGLYTEGDGIIHIHPLSNADAGDNATLGRFVSDYPGLDLTSTSLKYPGKGVLKNGDKCGGKPGKVQVKIWKNTLPKTAGLVLAGDPNNYKPPNDSMITVAFVPDGSKIFKPTQAQINGLLKVATTTTAAPATTVPLTSPPPSITPTSAVTSPSSTSATTATTSLTSSTG